jgi:hypothetical protein
MGHYNFIESFHIVGAIKNINKKFVQYLEMLRNNSYIFLIFLKGR